MLKNENFCLKDYCEINVCDPLRPPLSTGVAKGTPPTGEEVGSQAWPWNCFHILNIKVSKKSIISSEIVICTLSNPLPAQTSWGKL